AMPVGVDARSFGEAFVFDVAPLASFQAWTALFEKPIALAVFTHEHTPAPNVERGPQGPAVPPGEEALEHGRLFVSTTPEIGLQQRSSGSAARNMTKPPSPVQCRCETISWDKLGSLHTRY